MVGAGRSRPLRFLICGGRVWLSTVCDARMRIRVQKLDEFRSVFSGVVAVNSSVLETMEVFAVIRTYFCHYMTFIKITVFIWVLEKLAL